MSIRHLRSLKEHDDLLELKKDTLVVLDFHAAWCGPCHQIAPVFEQLSKSNTHLVFAKVDVDQVGEIAQKYSISAMPTFLFIRNKTVVGTLRGADISGLQRLVAKHSEGITASSSAGDGNSGDISLLEFVDSQQVNCLNEAEDHTLKTLLSTRSRNKNKDTYLLSDADEQLLLNIAFNQIVKVRSLIFHSADPTIGPKEIKVVVNNGNLGFDDFDNEGVATQSFEVTEDDLKDSKKINVRFVRFQNVTTLSIFVKSNQSDADETRIDAIDILGVPVQTTADLSGLKKQQDE